MLKKIQKSSTQHFLRHFLKEWLWVLLALVIVTYALSKSLTASMTNNYVYDRLLTVNMREADSRVVIIGVDDSSLQELGRWPWARTVHAEFFKQLKSYEPKSVLFDILTVEPSRDRADDKALGAAMSLHSRLAAPILLASYAGERPVAIMPVPEVAQATDLGQIVVTPDVDGVVREAHLKIADRDGRLWPTLASLMLDEKQQNDLLPSENSFRVPFNVRKGAYVTIPYWSVLNHQVDASYLKDKYVLVGPTAVGLGDQLTTPVSGRDGTVAGVETHANILDALLNHLEIRVLDGAWLNAANLFLPLFLLMAAFLWASEKNYLLAFLTVFGLYAALVVYLLWVQRFWMPPVVTCLSLLLAYLIWSWRRSIVVLKYVDSGLESAQSHLGRLPYLFSPEVSSKFLPRSLEVGMSQINQLYQFTGDSLMHLPTALLVVSDDGEILMSNQNAQALFGQIEGRLVDLLHRVDSSLVLSEDLKQLESWQDLQGLELSSRNKQFYQLHVTSVEFGADVNLLQNAAEAKVWLVNFLNLSAERAAQSERSELVEFLSHDLRSPQVSILSLLELQLHERTRVSEPELFAKVAEKVHLTLNWANDLVHLSKARSTKFKMVDMNLAHAIDEVLEQILPQAKAKMIGLVFDDDSREAAEMAWIKADGVLLMRSFVNLLSNAVRYSGEGTQIKVNIELLDAVPFAQNSEGIRWVACHIIDEGQGMSIAQVAHLNSSEIEPVNNSEFEPKVVEPDAAQSLGVGFIMARTVIERHGGHLLVSSELGVGSCMSVYLHISEEVEDELA